MRLIRSAVGRTGACAPQAEPPYRARWRGLGRWAAACFGAVLAFAVQADPSVPPAGPQLYYLHTDHLETPRAVSDATNTIVWRNSPLTEPFGLSPVEEDADANGSPFTLNLRFPGQLFDKETQTHYNYFRDYDPATGRYLQSDPIGLQGGINTYSYTGSSPLKYTDPKGLVKWSGEMYSVIGIDGAGGGQFEFDLKSECVNGKYAYIHVYASALMVGLGARYTGGGSGVSFDDHLNSLDPDGFTGGFKIVTAGVGAILTGSYSYLKLGNNVSDFSVVPSPGIGVDASIGGGVGRSLVTSVDIKDCGCKN